MILPLVSLLSALMLVPDQALAQGLPVLGAPAYSFSVPYSENKGPRIQLAEGVSPSKDKTAPAGKKREQGMELRVAAQDAEAALVEMFRLWDEGHNSKDRLMQLHRYGLERSRLAILLDRFVAQAGYYRPKCCGEGLRIDQTVAISRKTVYVYATVVLHPGGPYREITLQRRFRMVFEDGLWRTSLGWFTHPK